MLGEQHRSTKQQTHLLPFALPVVAATRRPIAEESKLLRMPAKAEDDRKARIVKVDMVLFSLADTDSDSADCRWGAQARIWLDSGLNYPLSRKYKDTVTMTT